MAVQAVGLGKRFDGPYLAGTRRPTPWALKDLDLDVPAGTILGLLGRNGAGKTTAIRILTTLALPTTGSATVAGHDVVNDAGSVRRKIGVAAQEATVDELLTARANLEMVGRLHHMSRKDASKQADLLLEQFGIADAATKQTKTLSGGMRRRLDLAASLVGRPEVLFLDEPTTGLDPLSRNELWAVLRDLVSEGSTIILTTQYLEEADYLADDIVVLAHGQTVAHGTPALLKSRIGNARLDVTVTSVDDLTRVPDATQMFASSVPSLDHATLSATISIHEGVRLMEVMRALDDAGIDVFEMNRREPTLDDVFLTLTDRRSSVLEGVAQ